MGFLEEGEYWKIHTENFFGSIGLPKTGVGTKILHIMLFNMLKVSGDFLKIQNVLISL